MAAPYHLTLGPRDLKCNRTCPVLQESGCLCPLRLYVCGHRVCAVHFVALAAFFPSAAPQAGAFGRMRPRPAWRGQG